MKKALLLFSVLLLLYTGCKKSAPAESAPVVNLAPTTPTLPMPADSAGFVSVSSALTWSCTDPNSDVLTYYIYFDTLNNPTKIVDTVKTASFKPDTLIAGKTYYWKVVAMDPSGLKSTGPVWRFTVSTIPAQVNIEWVLVEADTFTMGDRYAEGYANELPTHVVKIDSFYISKYEITFDQYIPYCDSAHLANLNDQGWGRGNLPVIFVSWYDAQAFCDAYNKTHDSIFLPTEAQWEYAARGGKLAQRFAGTDNSAGLSVYAWYNDAYSRTHTVGTKTPNALGIYDLNGNVWEWCRDWYDVGYYTSIKDSIAVNPAGANSGIFKVLRGGSWSDDSLNCRVSYRLVILPTGTGYNAGFRVVKKVTTN